MKHYEQQVVASRQLSHIKQDVEKFGNTISKVLDVDVLIVDYQLRIVSNTVRYFDKFTITSSESVIGSVIETGETVVVPDRLEFDYCQACAECGTCEMSAFIGVPIQYEGAVIGAVSLVVPKHRKGQIFRDVRTSVEFLKNIASLIASKMRNYDEMDALEFIRSEREELIDAMDDAIVSTDSLGYITWCNKEFKRRFTEDGSGGLGAPIWTTIDHPLMVSLLNHPEDIDSRPVLLQQKDRVFSGTVSVRHLKQGGRGSTLLTFRSIQPGEGSGLEQTPTFRWEDGRYFPKDVQTSARRIATSDEACFLHGEEGSGVEILAWCIHNFSNRAQSGMQIVDCGSLYGGLEFDRIFGSFGVLQRGDGGTVFFQHIERMPYGLQQELSKFLRTGALPARGAGIVLRPNVRLLFSSGLSIDQLMEGRCGLYDELYYRIIQTIINLPPLRESPEFLKQTIQDRLSDYWAAGHTVTLSRDAMALLRGYHWPGNLAEVDYVLERLVHQCRGEVSQQVIARMELLSRLPVTPLDELERDKIAELLRLRRSKEDIARLLGISRATLYRKIKQYQL